MTEDISNYTFDFDKEVDDLRHSLGFANRSGILFADVNVSAGHVKIKSIKGGWLSKALSSSDVRHEANQQYKKKPNFSSYCSTDDRYIFLRENDSFNESFGEKNKSPMLLFSLYHETGHALIPSPSVDDDHPFGECAADAYAALRLFQRFGQEAGPLLSMISWHRTLEAVGDSTSHLSTAALDKIIADSAHRDFSKLTADETIALAITYAKEWTPEPSMLSAVRKVFRHEGQIKLEVFSETCLATSNNFAFYIGAKFFQPFLQPEGVSQNGTTIQLFDDDKREYAAALQERAATLSLSKIFKKAAAKPTAEPPLTELLKVSLPKGQKQFFIKTS